ncbi:MAG: Ig-like domain-containing protein [Lachnospiraceae bacterium]|nr:Ig-like domain-containing protein [Lachnospiraceae bacterium]
MNIALFAFAVVFILSIKWYNVNAADPQVDIWHNDTNTSARYTSRTLGNSESIGLHALNTTINSATWASSNSSAASVIGDKNGATVKALKEGAVKITVTANTSDGTLKDDYIFNSVTDIPDAAAVTNGSAQLMRGCTSDSLSRDTVSTGFKFTITGKCGSYYFGKLPPDYQKPDNLGDYVFILKSKLNIPATGFTYKTNSSSLTVGVRNKITPTIVPSLVNMHQYVDWSSSNQYIATIDKNGNITPYLPGTVTFTGKIHGTNISKTITMKSVLTMSKIKAGSVFFKDLYVTWPKVRGASKYQIYRYESKYKKYICRATVGNTDRYRDKNLKEGTNYYYYVIPFAKRTINRVAREVPGTKSANIKITTNKLKLVAKSDRKVTLTWNKISGNISYKKQRWITKKKITTSVNKRVGLSNTKLKRSTYYYYKITPFIKDGKKITYFTPATTLKVGTYGKTNGYFAEQIKYPKKNRTKPEWPGIAMTYAPASTSAMNNYMIPDAINGGKFKSPIKYNYSTKNKTLYIHVYVKFSGPGMNQKFQEYREVGYKYVYKKTDNVTYKTLAKRGFVNYWYVNVKGNKYDFGSGINFKTKVVLHEGGNIGQRYVSVIIGDNSINGMSDMDKSQGYWHFVRGASRWSSKLKEKNGKYKMYYGYSSTEIVMHLATQYQTAIANKGRYYNSPEETYTDYASVAGHELGHYFGISDAYNDKNNRIIRVTPTDEIGTPVKKEDKWDDGVENIMEGTRNFFAVSNDIEMILQAQGDAINNKTYSYQAYRSYASGDKKQYQYKKSVVIRK